MVLCAVSEARDDDDERGYYAGKLICFEWVSDEIVLVLVLVLVIFEPAFPQSSTPNKSSRSY
jgi:hypothetical protein